MPWQKADLDQFGLGSTEAAEAAWLIAESRPVHRGHRAIGAALTACGGGWRLVGRLVLLPPPLAWIAAGIYAAVARWRRFLPGIAPACSRRYRWEAAPDRPCRAENSRAPARERADVQE